MKAMMAALARRIWALLYGLRRELVYGKYSGDRYRPEWSELEFLGGLDVLIARCFIRYVDTSRPNGVWALEQRKGEPDEEFKNRAREKFSRDFQISIRDTHPSEVSQAGVSLVTTLNAQSSVTPPLGSSLCRQRG